MQYHFTKLEVSFPTRLNASAIVQTPSPSLHLQIDNNREQTDENPTLLSLSISDFP